jgi:hypothetical protein
MGAVPADAFALGILIPARSATDSSAHMYWQISAMLSCVAMVLWIPVVMVVRKPSPLVWFARIALALSAVLCISVFIVAEHYGRLGA